MGSSHVRLHSRDRGQAAWSGGLQAQLGQTRVIAGSLPCGQRNLRASSWIGRSLMLAKRVCMNPSASNSQLSLPYGRIPVARVVQDALPQHRGEPCGHRKFLGADYCDLAPSPGTSRSRVLCEHASPLRKAAKRHSCEGCARVGALRCRMRARCAQLRESGNSRSSCAPCLRSAKLAVPPCSARMCAMTASPMPWPGTLVVRLALVR